MKEELFFSAELSSFPALKHVYHMIREPTSVSLEGQLSLENFCCRIDCFSELSTNAFGEKLKEQVEERLRFYEEGIAPTKNSTAMQEALASARVSFACAAFIHDRV